VTWTWADYLVIALCVGQIGLLVAAFVLMLRIKNGPVTTAVNRASDLVEKVSALAENGQKAYAKSEAHVAGIAASLQGIAASVRPVAEPAGLLFGYGDLRRWYGNALLARTTVAEVRRRLKPAAPAPVATAATATAGRSRIGLPRVPASGGSHWAERLGLVPPLVTRAAPLYRAARVGWQAYRAVQGQRGGGPGAGGDGAA
jgi:hypothetical protein